MHIPVFMLDAPTGTATVLAQGGGQDERAVELAALVLNQPAAHPETKERAQRLLSEMEPQVSAPTFAAAQKRGKQGDIEYYVNLCKTLGGPDSFTIEQE